VNRYAAAALYALIVIAGLYLADQLGFFRLDTPRSPGIWTLIGAAVVMLLAQAGAALSAGFDRLGRPRGLMVLGLAVLAAAAVLNAVTYAGGLVSLRPFLKEFALFPAAVGLLVPAFFTIGRAGLRLTVFFIASFLALTVAWAIRPFEVIFVHSVFSFTLSGLFLAVLFGSMTLTRRRLLRPLSFEVLAAVLALAGAGAAQLGAHQLLAAKGIPPRPRGETAWPAVQRPHIILIVWDTVRRDHLSLYGYERRTTPFLEGWRPQATVYTRAISVAPWTIPSHASMFTGLYPRTHGADFIYAPGKVVEGGNFRPLDGNFRTLAEVLAERGYRCGAVSANYVCAGRKAGMAQGFGYFNDQVNTRSVYWPQFDLQCFLIDTLKPWIPPRFFSLYLEGFMTAEEVTDRALAWIDSAPTDQPIFLFLNFMDAHQPTYPPEDQRYLFPGFQRDLLDKNLNDIFIEMLEEGRPVSERERAHFLSQYDAQIVSLDRELERLRGGLIARGIFDRALVVVTSDHGEFFGEHGLLGHGMDVYEEVLAIPLVVRRPGGAEPAVNDQPFENRGLFSLLEEAAGIVSEPENRPWDSEAVFFPVYRILPNGKQMLPNARLRRAIYFGDYKLIESSDGHNELYRLGRDPKEASNLFMSVPEEARKGKQLLQEFLRRTPEAQTPISREKLDPEHAQKLRALGYVQ
jgi:arylsulfatase A-like enzyme